MPPARTVRAVRARRQEERRHLTFDLGNLALVEALGEAGRDRLFAGEPMVVPFSRLPGMPAEEGLFREWLATRSPDLAALDPGELGRYSAVLTRERHPSNPLAGGLVMSLVKPSGFDLGHGNLFPVPVSSPDKRHLESLGSPVKADAEAAGYRDLPGGRSPGFYLEIFSPLYGP